MSRSFLGPSLLVAVTLLVLSGACSQHAPGPYEGGGRDVPTSEINGISMAPPEVDSSVQDNAVPDVTIDIKPDIATQDSPPG